MGTTAFWLGELTQARDHLEQGIALYDAQQHRSLTLLYGQDPRVTCLGYAAWTLWLLGYADQALQRGQEALTLAQEIAHPFTLAFALSWVGYVRLVTVRRRVAPPPAAPEPCMQLSPHTALQ
jgi:hypothetical protein